MKDYYVGDRLPPRQEGNSLSIWFRDQMRMPNVIFWAILIVIVYFGITFNGRGNVQVMDGKIFRTYDEIFSQLEEEPEDITVSKYEEHIPDIIQQDIQVMMNSREDIKIVYQKSDNISRIMISKSENGAGIEVEVSTYRGVEDYTILRDDISFYKHENNIIIYGTPYYGSRGMQRCRLSLDEDGYDSTYTLYEHQAVDIWGTDMEAYDFVRTEAPNMTLTRKGNEFAFYYLGEQVTMRDREPKVAEFPGAVIVEFNYRNGYILDANGDLYYLYYATYLDDPWIEFVKVAEKIDYITDETVKLKGDEYYRPLEFVVYMKSGLRYAGVTDYYTERCYGLYNGSGKIISGAPASVPDFTVHTVCIDDENASTVTLKRDNDSAIGTTYYDWKIRYEFETGGAPVYIEKRLNGLDRDIVRYIPQERLDPYDGMAIAEEQIQTVKDELKAIYAEYE